MGDAEDAEDDNISPEASQTRTLEESPERSSDSNYTVLLVEDDQLTSKIVADTLKACRYSVMEAENGRIALEILESDLGKQVDIVLTDNLMPEVSGIELLDQLLRKEQCQNLPVVMMSTDNHKEVVVKAFEAGATDFLVKPLKREKLVSLWKHAATRSRGVTDNNPGSQNGKLRQQEPGMQQGGDLFKPAQICIRASAGSAFHEPCNGQAASKERDSSNAKRPRLDPVVKCVKPGTERLALDPWSHNLSWLPRHKSGLDPASMLSYHPLRLVQRPLLRNNGKMDLQKTSLEIKPLLRTGTEDCSAHHQPVRGWGALASAREQDEAGASRLAAEAVAPLQHREQSSAFTIVLPEAKPAHQTDGLTKGYFQDQQRDSKRKRPSLSLPASAEFAISPIAMQHQLILQALNATQAAGISTAQSRSATTANRRAAIERFRAKRNQRNFEKKVRYASRQRLAENRPRIRGQFVKASSHEGEDAKDASSTPE